MSDYGDQYPSDTGDVKPGSQTQDYQEGNVRLYDRPGLSINPLTNVFDNSLGYYDPPRTVAPAYVGIIIGFVETVDEIDYYTVLLKSGDEVVAKYFNPGRNSFYEVQTVQVIRGQAADEYYISEPLDRPIEIFKGRLTETLVPGDKASAEVLEHQGGFAWGLTGDTIDLCDDSYKNFGLTDDEFEYAYNYDTQHAFIIGSQGLIQNGVSDAGITDGGSGSISIYDDSGDTGVNVTAYLDWITNSTAMSVGKKCIVKYYSRHRKWIIIDRECE